MCDSGGGGGCSGGGCDGGSIVTVVVVAMAVVMKVVVVMVVAIVPFPRNCSVLSLRPRLMGGKPNYRRERERKKRRELRR